MLEGFFTSFRGQSAVTAKPEFQFRARGWVRGPWVAILRVGNFWGPRGVPGRSAGPRVRGVPGPRVRGSACVPVGPRVRGLVCILMRSFGFLSFGFLAFGFLSFGFLSFGFLSFGFLSFGSWCILMNSNESKWILMGPNESWCILMHPNESYWVLMNSNES